MCGGVQNVSRPMERCQEISHWTPTIAEVTPMTRRPQIPGNRRQGDGARLRRAGNTTLSAYIHGSGVGSGCRPRIQSTPLPFQDLIRFATRVMISMARSSTSCGMCRRHDGADARFAFGDGRVSDAGGEQAFVEERAGKCVRGGRFADHDRRDGRLAGAGGEARSRASPS